jgi:DNA polymerase I-like protein with 3'-5' exonuclease and polymerase domains
MPRIKEYNYSYLAERCYDQWYDDQPQAIAVDTETKGLSWYDEPFAATVAWDGGSWYLELDDKTSFEVLRELLTTPSLVFHNAKFDLQKLIMSGSLARDQLTPERIEDTEAIHHLLWEHKPKRLKAMAKDLLGVNTDETDAIKKARKKLKLTKDDGYHLLPRAVVVPYAVKDAEYTWRLYEMLKGRLKDEELDLYHLEMELCLVLLDVEAAGMRVDTNYVEKTTKEYAGKILATDLRIADLTGLRVWTPEKQGQKTPEGCINLNSWQQLLPVLHERGIMVDATGNDILQPYADEPFVAAILERRNLTKTYGTYLLGIKRETRDGIIHPNFRQHGTKTGRMSSGGAEDG